MAGPPQEAAESFEVNIEVGDSALQCRVYFKNPGRVIVCAQCHVIPYRIYSLDNNHPLCIKCFCCGLVGSSSDRSIQTGTHQDGRRPAAYNTAILDATVTCPGCGGIGDYPKLKEHIERDHRDLLRCAQLHQPPQVEIGKGLSQTPPQQSQKQEIEQLPEVSRNMEGLPNCTKECAPPEEVKTESTSDSETEQNKHTMVLLLESQRWFKKQLLKYYDLHLEGFYSTEGKDASYFQDHIQRCPMVSPIHVKWFSKALSKYHELRKKQRLGCNETCSNFLEHAAHSEDFLSEVKAVSADEMFGYFQEHTNGCRRKSHSKDTTKPEARPATDKTTAAMTFEENYSLKDFKGLADGILIPFKEKLNPELACCICNALTPTGLKDGKGHTYCAYCTRVHTDALGLFTCSLCGWQAAPSEMRSNGEEWGILEKLTAACPNDNPKCTYQGTFKDVLVHYKSCALKTKVECPLCKSFHDRKTLVIHMAKNCSKRVVECKFCNSDIEAWEKEIHEGSCRHRPGTCKYCLQQFATIIELEEEHQPQCPKMPVKCSFYQLGCSFSAARSDVVSHEATTKHTDMLMEHVCLLKAENESLKRTIENQEKKFQGIIDNLKDSLSKIENRTNVAFERRQARYLRMNPCQTTLGEEASAGTRQREFEERLEDVEEKLRSYQLPFEQLLRSISRLQ